MPTILDVARRAGVSKSLVSMVARGETGVSNEKRTAILKAIDELDYRPNAMAQGLVMRQTRILGVMVSDLQNPFFAAVISGIQERAEERGFRVLITTGDRTPSVEESAIENLLQLRVDGLILASPRVDDEVVDRVGRSIPVVVLNRDTSDDTSDSVTNDNISGAHLAIEHLVSFGHRRIAFIEGGAGAGARIRHQGYLSAMHDFGLEDEMMTVEGRHTEEGGYQGAMELLKMKALPTAVFASNDLCAIGAMNAFEEAGLNIPDDLSLVGYDNNRMASMRQISLTTIDQPGDDMGRSAVERLAERIDGDRTEPSHDVVTPSLVVRSTTGPPRFEAKS
jgi:DNA-binding LacI/PurR family transcriptional regulator